MTKYRIINTAAGTVLGEYNADSADEALDMLAQDAGYRSYRHAREIMAATGENVVVSECPTYSAGL